MNGRDLQKKLCLVCHKICDQDVARCPRCGAGVSTRLNNSLSRSWALTITAVLLYIPANMLPMMTVSKFGSGQPDTIMSGVISLANHGMMPIAILVFVASIMIPLLKLLGMAWLLMSVHRAKKHELPLSRKMTLYRLIVWIGRWSMLDIFIISLLAGLVQFGQLGQVTAGAGAWAFSAVVVMTMLAAIIFDPRLLWDAREVRNTGSLNSLNSLKEERYESG